MELLFGPPGSGKTSRVVEELRAALRRGETSCRILLPTTTMAEHLRNQLAREGLVFRPNTVATFSKFVSELAPEVPLAPVGGIESLVDEALRTQPLPQYAGVKEFVGFRRSVARAIEELSAAGAWSNLLDEGEFRSVCQFVEKRMAERKWVFARDRLKIAAERMADADLSGFSTFLFAGFYSFTPPEWALLEALEKRCPVKVTLPEGWDPGQPSKLPQLPTDLAGVQPACFAAPTMDQECVEIARRVMEERAAGRAFREIGIVVRTENAWVPALRTALERFGIPARFYFGQPLSQHAVIRYLLESTRAVLSGADFEDLVQPLSSPCCPEASPGFTHRILEQIPAKGVAALREIHPGERKDLFESLAALERAAQRTAGPAEWAQRFRSLTALVRKPRPGDQISHERALEQRQYAAAFHAWDQACAEAGELFEGAAPIPALEFLRLLEMVIDGSTLRVPDHRRDVVHVLDAYEARQWKLPVLFLCGLLEQEFPRYHPENPVLPDVQRRKLQTRGVPVKTTEQRQEEEAFLFAVACTRATEKLFLSYPKMNAKGDANLESFFLREYLSRHGIVTGSAKTARPLAKRKPAPLPFPILYDDELRIHLENRFRKFSASSIEKFLSCPFQFFAAETLRLSEAPDRPWARLNALVQGSIVHGTLERVVRDGLPLHEAFAEEFVKHTSGNGVPDGYRTEAVRLEMLENLKAALDDARLHPRGESLYENGFELDLEGYTITGRIDRIDLLPAGQALVVDYKYSAKAEKYQDEHEAGSRVQGGLYLRALPKFGDFEHGGMVYAGVRGKPKFSGWVTEASSAERLRMSCAPEVLREQIDQAVQTTLRVIQDIHHGVIEPRPSDVKYCQYCAMNAGCRYDAAAGAEQTEAAG